jgi:hypothetical protein
MPFLQAFLPCMVFAELVRILVIRSRAWRGRGRMLTALLTSALLVYAFALSRMIYPEYDL